MSISKRLIAIGYRGPHPLAAWADHDPRFTLPDPEPEPESIPARAREPPPRPRQLDLFAAAETVK
jgi:hypothetical protein